MRRIPTGWELEPVDALLAGMPLPTRPVGLSSRAARRAHQLAYVVTDGKGGWRAQCSCGYITPLDGRLRMLSTLIGHQVEAELRQRQRQRHHRRRRPVGWHVWRAWAQALRVRSPR